MDLNENPLCVDEEYLSFIGSATAVWSEVDITLQILMWKLLGFDNDEDSGLAVTNHMAFNNKIHLTKTLVNIWFERGDMSKINHDLLLEDIEKANQLSQYRNKIMHGYFRTDDAGETYIMHVAARGRINQTMHFKTLDDFRYFINAASCISYNLWGMKNMDWSNSLPTERHETLPDKRS